MVKNAGFQFFIGKYRVVDIGSFCNSVLNQVSGKKVFYNHWKKNYSNTFQVCDKHYLLIKENQG